MTRRAALLAVAVAGALLAVPARAGGEPAAHIHRVAILRFAGPPLEPDDPQAVGIPDALRALGYVEGRNLVLDLRYADGDLDRLARFAAAMVSARADVIVAVGAASIRAARQASPTIPIVMFANVDPVATGLVATLARPGENTTGVLIAPEGTLAGKRLELLHAAIPGAMRIALLAPQAQADFATQADETRKAAAHAGLALSVVEVRDGDYGRAFAEIASTGAGGLLVGAHNFFVRDRRRIIDLAATYRIPAMYEWREHVQDGGLMSYSTSLAGVHQRVAELVDRILKGAKAGDLPIEQPTRFEFVINAKTARTLGLTIPAALRLQVDDVIE